MIVVDTSALMALLLAEPEADRIADILEAEERIMISAGTLAEAAIVAARRGVAEELRLLLDGLGVEVDPLGAVGAHAVADAYARWGEGLHPAALNFGDCFAYASAKGHDAPLLFVGDDFTKTDVANVL
jgi:ribonuclease VapC